MSEEGPDVKLARLDERLKVAESELKALNTKLWAGIAVLLAYFFQELLKLIGKG